MSMAGVFVPWSTPTSRVLLSRDVLEDYAKVVMTTPRTNAAKAVRTTDDIRKTHSFCRSTISSDEQEGELEKELQKERLVSGGGMSSQSSGYAASKISRKTGRNIVLPTKVK